MKEKEQLMYMDACMTDCNCKSLTMVSNHRGEEMVNYNMHVLKISLRNDSVLYLLISYCFLSSLTSVFQDGFSFLFSQIYFIFLD